MGQSEAGRRRVGWLIAGATLVALLLSALPWWLSLQAPSEPVSPRPVARGSTSAAERVAPPAREASARLDGRPPSPGRDEPQPLPSAATPAERRLARAEHTLSSYLSWARYPPSSRPARENPDVMRPHQIATPTYRLRRGDRKVTDARVTTRQSRLQVVGDEAVELGLRCENSDGPQRCDVVAAAARKAVDPTFALEPSGAAVVFAQGEGGWAVATFRALSAGFERHQGGVNIDVKVRVGSEEGATGFHLELTPEAPARFTGAARDALVDGSLVFELGVEVARPGRYVVTGRVDDADGKPVALCEFNEQLGQGAQAVRLLVFGKLVHDEAPRQPLTLRDVDGFLRLEEGDVDRMQMATLAGPVHTAQTHPIEAFSRDEWQSEEKSRHVTEYKKDVDEARAEAGR